MSTSVARRVLPRIRHVAVPEATSTQDLCRELVEKPDYDPQSVLAVTADRQTRGRGTSGRAWESPVGNVLLTIAVPKHLIPQAVLPVYPLLAGIVIRDTVAHALRDAQDPHPSVKAKWPNDVLVDGAKVSGCIIEDGGDAMLVGIGINVAVAPATADGGRRTACVNDFCAEAHRATAAVCAKDCAERLVAATVEATSRMDVVERYRAIMATDCAMYTRGPDGRRGRRVTPVHLGEWGELTIVDETGAEETLVADYLI